MSGPRRNPTRRIEKSSVVTHSCFPKRVLISAIAAKIIESVRPQACVLHQVHFIGLAPEHAPVSLLQHF